MSVSSRRWAAFAGGCLVGIGLGALTSAVNSAANWYANYPNITDGTAASTSAMWIACLIIGAGLGTALAAMIREERRPGLNRSEQPGEATGVGQDASGSWPRSAGPAHRP